MCIPIGTMSNHSVGTSYVYAQRLVMQEQSVKSHLLEVVLTRWAQHRGRQSKTTPYVVNSNLLVSVQVHTDPRAKPAYKFLSRFPSLPTSAGNTNFYTPLLLLFIVFVQSSTRRCAYTYLFVTPVYIAASRSLHYYTTSDFR